MHDFKNMKILSLNYFIRELTYCTVAIGKFNHSFNVRA